MKKAQSNQTCRSKEANIQTFFSLCDTLYRLQSAIRGIAASDHGSKRDGKKRNVGNGVEIFSGLSVSNPKALLPRTFESGVVALALGSQGVN